jgi:hypothetical protein
MYAFYICLAAYLVFTYYERIKCIYINTRAAVGRTHLSGRAKAHGPLYLPIHGPLNGSCRPGPVTDRVGPCLDRAKFVSCHGLTGGPHCLDIYSCTSVSQGSPLTLRCYEL